MVKCTNFSSLSYTENRVSSLLFLEEQRDTLSDRKTENLRTQLLKHGSKDIFQLGLHSPACHVDRPQSFNCIFSFNNKTAESVSWYWFRVSRKSSIMPWRFSWPFIHCGQNGCWSSAKPTFLVERQRTENDIFYDGY